MEAVIRSDPKIMHGAPCFAGTRVPVRSLFDHLKLGYGVEEFLRQFPTVRREQVDAVLDMAREKLQEMVEPAGR